MPNRFDLIFAPSSCLDANLFQDCHDPSFFFFLSFSTFPTRPIFLLTIRLASPRVFCMACEKRKSVFFKRWRKGNSTKRGKTAQHTRLLEEGSNWPIAEQKAGPVSSTRSVGSLVARSCMLRGKGEGSHGVLLLLLLHGLPLAPSWPVGLLVQNGQKGIVTP